MSDARDRPVDRAEKIAAAIDRLARAQRHARQRAATTEGVTLLQLELLLVLGDGPPPDPVVGRLALELGVTQPTVTDSLRALERKELVERWVDPDDARRTLVMLTARGRRVATRLRTADAELVAAIEALPPEHEDDMLEGLLTVIARLVETGGIDVARTCFTCRFHERRPDGTHRCTLLEADLAPGELRVNCPEHVPAGA